MPDVILLIYADNLVLFRFLKTMLCFQEITVRSDGPNRMPDFVRSLAIYNCSRVYIMPDALEKSLLLEDVKFVSIGSFSLMANSLNRGSGSNWKPYKGIKIFIYNSTVEEIGSYAIKGSIGEIVIDSSVVNAIRSYAVSNINDLTDIKIINSTIRQIDTQAFKKFSFEKLHIKMCKFRELPSRMFSDLKLSEEFVFDSNNVERIRSSFCIINGPRRVKFENCKIGTMDGESLKIVTEGIVYIKNNEFDEIKTKAFFGISVIEKFTTRREKIDLFFSNNTVSKLEENALDINEKSFRPSFTRLLTNEICDCHHSYFNLTTTIKEDMYCNRGKPDDIHYVLLKDYNKDYCIEKKFSSAILSLIIVLGIVCLILIFTIVVVIVKNNDQKNISGKSDRLNIVKPDGKTYKETELFVFIEKADVLTTSL